jgi:succinyl-diaminopimelate desuccinylase
VPAQALLSLDIRTIPAQSHPFLEQAIRSLVDEVAACTPGFSAAVEVIEDRPCTLTAKDDPVVVASAEAYRMVTGKEPVYNGVPGATDGTFLWAWKQIPIVTYGAGGRTVPHQKDEFVEIPELIETARIYTAAAMLYLGEKR